MNKLLIPTVLAAAALGGCTNPCPQPTRVDEMARAPGRVDLLFEVTCSDAPFDSLDASQLRLVEEGVEVSDPDTWVVRRVADAMPTWSLLLVDVSQTTTIDEETFEAVREGARLIATSLAERGEFVGVHMFDGATYLREISVFTDDPVALSAALDDFTAEDQVDGSSNLHGALVAGLEQLDAQTASTPASPLVGVGQLIVIATDVDRSGRVTASKVTSAMRGSAHGRFVLSVGDQTMADALSDLAPTHVLWTDSLDDVAGSTAEDTVELAASRADSHYLLSYCSPLRSGRASLEVELTIGERSRAVKTTYDTTDFGPGCSLPEAIR